MAEGRDVTQTIGGLVDRGYELLGTNRITRYPFAVIQVFSQAQGALLSGAVAYYTFLSLPSLMLVTGFVLGRLSSGRLDLQNDLAAALEKMFPDIVGANFVDQLVSSSTALGVTGLLLLAYSGSGFVGAVTACMNRMWKLEAGRNPFIQKVVNLVSAMMLIVLLMAPRVLDLTVTSVADLFDAELDVGWLELLDRFLGPVFTALGLMLVYHLLPAARRSWRHQLPGALAATVAAGLLQWAFAVWAGNSAGVSALPRGVVSISLALIYLGFFSQVVLYGAALNVVLDRRSKGMPLYDGAPEVPER